MIVQSVLSSQQYRLPQEPLSRQFDGAVYSVIGRPDLQVKIYSPSNRTPSTEKCVVDAINGVGGMIGEFPIDMVRLEGRFAGYVFQTPQIQEPELPVVPVQTDISRSTRLLIYACISVLLSVLIYFPIFDAIQNIMEPVYCTWFFNGIPVIAGGIIAAIIAYSSTRFMHSAPALIISTVAYIAGSLMVFGAIYLTVRAVVTAASVLTATLPTIFTIAIIAFLLKAIFKR